MKVAAAHCNPKKQPALNHNDRTNDTAKTITKELTHLNEYSCSSDEVRKKIDKLYKEAQENFSNYCATKNGLTKAGKPKGLQNFTKKEKCYHEFIYEINENTTMAECQELTQKIAELTGFTPLQVVIHRDEVFKNDKGESQTHYHAHAVFFTLDKETGLQLARQEGSLNKQNLSKIQTMASESLKMERGKNRYESGEAQPQYIQDYKDYARFKEQEKELKNSFRLWRDGLNQKEAKIKELEAKLREKENELEKRERDFQEQIAKLQQSHRESFDKLLQESNKQKSLWKNIITLGGHNQKVENEYRIKKEALGATLTQAEQSVKREIKQYREQAQRDIQIYEEKAKKAKQLAKELQEKLEKSEAERKRVIEVGRKYENRANLYEQWIRNNLTTEQIQDRFPELAYRISEEQLTKIERSLSEQAEKIRGLRQGR